MLQRDHFAVHVAGNSAHVVVHGGQHRDGILVHVHAREDARGLGDAGQARVNHLGPEMLEMQVDVVLVLADAAAFADLDGHRTRHHVARGQVLGVGRVTLHESFAVGVGEVTALAARAFGDQAARAVDAGGMELHELHVLHRQSGAQRHAAAVAGAGVRRGAGEIRAAVAAGGEDHGMRAVAMQPARGHVQRHHAAAGAVLHDEIEREVFDEELGVVLDRLLVQRVQHRVAGAVGRGAGAVRRALAVMRGHAAEWPLVDAAVVGARERHAVVLELDDRGRRFLAHELDGVLVAEPVRALDGVVEMEAPVVLAHVAERGGDAALRGHGMAARREHLREAGGR